MAYRYATASRDHSDLASGRVLFSAPGFPAFPVRLASEIFQCARARGTEGPVTVWDPCCGSGYLLTTLAILHRKEISGVIASDVDPVAVSLARRNLRLLAPHGLHRRASALRERAELFGKPAYADAAAAAERLAAARQEDNPSLSTRVAIADVFDPRQLREALGDERPGLVITDVPYGEQTTWSGRDPDAALADMLSAVAEVVDRRGVIAISARGRRVGAGEGHRRLASFRIGSRAVAIFAAPDS
ncbi:hypothetical protein V6S02_13635 [Microbacterium sp. CCNWLW134]|uniref:hypothetical protein n=1 Tax=Microbacterium sp. CCNWLW134 TaxID=3122064 RepID=UPI00300FA7AC